MADGKITQLDAKTSNELTGDEYLVSAETGENNKVQLNEVKKWLNNQLIYNNVIPESGAENGDIYIDELPN